MKRISLEEFKYYCSSLNNYVCFFNSSDQNWECKKDMADIQMSFKDISVYCYPDYHTICFHGDNSCMNLFRVKSICLSELESGIKLSIKCSPFVLDKSIEYIFLIQKCTM